MMMTMMITMTMIMGFIMLQFIKPKAAQGAESVSACHDLKAVTYLYAYAVLKYMTIRHAETCENRLRPVNSCVNFVRQTREIYQILPHLVYFKAHWELWNPRGKTVLSK